MRKTVNKITLPISQEIKETTTTTILPEVPNNNVVIELPNVVEEPVITESKGKDKTYSEEEIDKLIEKIKQKNITQQDKKTSPPKSNNSSYFKYGMLGLGFIAVLLNS